MFPVGPLTSAPDLTSTNSKGHARASSGSGKRSQSTDEVDLSATASAVPRDRSALIAALREVVSSPDYLPPSLPTSQKLVAGALSGSN
jgi:hypothetical protein